MAQRERNGLALWPLLLTGLLCLMGIAAQRRYGLNLGDEGFLWYGAQRVLTGELPLRDFQAYDPGRYFWSAALMRLFGDDGILALRWSNALLSAITAVIATRIVTFELKCPRPAPTLVVGLIFALWMVPGFKAADSFAAVVLLLGLTRLVRRPSLGRYFQAGFCLGLAATIGINHALYGSIASLLAFLYLRGAPGAAASAAAASLGAAAGYSPVLALHLLAPGFTAAFVDSVRIIFEAGVTNFAVPIPRLSALLELSRRSVMAVALETAMALIFLGVPVLWAAMAWHLRRPAFRAGTQAPVLAGFFLSLPYAHHVYSRADSHHLAISILPVLVLVLAYAQQAGTMLRRLIVTSVLGASVVVTAHLHPAYARLRGIYLTQIVDAGRDRLLVSREDATLVRAVQDVARAAGTKRFFAGPYLPGAYALAGRKSPTWEIYLIFPASAVRQAAEIERLKAADTDYAIMVDSRWDGRQDLGLSRTHPLVLAYLRSRLPSAYPVSNRPPLVIFTRQPVN